MRFADRRDAGRRLGAAVAAGDHADPVVLALPRGGVPVGFEVAQALAAPLDVLVVRKIGAPFQPELGVGALAESGAPILNAATMQRLGLGPDDVAATIAAERVELARRLQRYRGGRAPLPVKGRTAIVVDDGLATGGTARAAVAAIRARKPAAVVLAVPVAAPETLDLLAPEVDELVCLAAPERFSAVGQWYEIFDQTPDEEVEALLAAARDA